MDVFIDQSVCLFAFEGALAFVVCVLEYTIHLAVGVFSGQSVYLCLRIGALVFVCVYFVSHYPFSYGYVRLSISRLALSIGALVFFVFVLGYTISPHGDSWSRIGRMRSRPSVRLTFRPPIFEPTIRPT